MTGPFYFNFTGGWSGNVNHSESGSGTQMKWIPFDYCEGSDDFKRSLWAYTGGALIRSNGPKSVVILDFRGPGWNW
ncbi:hypothetical protein FIBSPDRAFT_874442 [Athelia psychrophila]|uniref:Uncharacterized protein n=1 Tax=Athelia psychrophila TaxID=1759441 RepID=A0A165XGH1_9AGAM|nr:hypothetical protein FIBSPDRAFT_874442 [Fibularhizoctonia sp. CBS 109695]